MRPKLRTLLLLLIGSMTLPWCPVAAQDSVLAAIRQSRPELAGQSRAGIEVSGLTEPELDILQGLADADPENRLQQCMTVYVDGLETPVWGSVRTDGQRLVWEPRFALRANVDYRVEWQGWSGTLQRRSDETAPLVLSLPAVASPNDDDGTDERQPAVEAVYPSDDELPQNVLRMYLVFHQPMARGKAYRHIRFEDETGREIPDTYLKVAEELWSRDGRRLTLLFDPGRIKRGLQRNEDLGPAFRVGQSVTLVVDAAMVDTNGRPLAEPFRQSWRIAPPVRSQPDVNSWDIVTPPAGSKAPLRVIFDRPLDRAMLEHSLSVEGPAEAEVAGTIAIGDDERSWAMVPNHPWVSGRYRIRLAPDLEDRSGNSLRRPFERRISGDPIAAQPTEIGFFVSGEK